MAATQPCLYRAEARKVSNFIAPTQRTTSRPSPGVSTRHSPCFRSPADKISNNEEKRRKFNHRTAQKATVHVNVCAHNSPRLCYIKTRLWMSSGPTIGAQARQIPFGFAAQVSFNPTRRLLLPPPALSLLHVAHNSRASTEPAPTRIFIDTDAACYHGMQ